MPSSVEAGATVTLESAATSGLPVTLTSDTPETCVVEDGVLVALAPGPCTVSATQAGDDTFAPAVSVELQTTIESALDEPLPQVITFSLPSSILAGATIALDGTADSGLVVSYTADTPATCSVAGSVLTAVAPGPCQVTASQAGDAVYAPAENVQASTTVEPQPPDPVAQAITFALPSSTLDGSSLVLSGTASSGLAVEYASSTPSVCSVSDVTLTALAVGTCSVTSSQPGNAEYLPAPNVGASMAVEAVPQGVDLGKYAVNGPVHDVGIEPGTGRTFLGGDFTQIGVRTGPVAVVDPPDLGDGKLKPASPEVLGTVRYVFADDRPGDPGFFIVGELIAVNGTPVPASPLTRMHLNSAATRWVVDTTFALDEVGDAFCSNLASFGVWMATEDKLVVGGNTNVFNPVGLWFVDRVTGECTASLPGIEQPLPILDGCSDQTYCYGTVNRMDWDPETGSLYVVYITWIGAENAETTWFATRYDLAPVTWSWTRQLQAVSGGGFVFSMDLVDDRLLLRGDFWLDAGGAENTRSHLLAVNSTTGAISQRWNRFGEQHLVGGGTLAPANDCLTSELPRGEFFDLGDDAAHWIGRDPALCRYAVESGVATAAAVPGVSLTDAQAWVAPMLEYTDGSGDDYLLGPWMAVALPSGDVVDWRPEPSTTHPSTSIAISSAGIVIGGDFQFVRGDPAVGVAALTASLSPDPAFTSPLEAHGAPMVRAVALHDGWLLVGGSALYPEESSDPDARTLLALDPRTGALNEWVPDNAPSIVETIAVDPDGGEFWVGGASHSPFAGSGTSLLRFEAPSAGADPLPAPALTCMSPPILVGHYPSTPVCQLPGNDGTHVFSLAFDAGGRLYIAGAFGTVDGSPRPGLARLNASLQLEAWDADLLGAIPIADGHGLYSLEPYSIAALSDRVIVGGRFASIRPAQGGGGSITAVSPLFVFSASSGELVRPTDPEAFAWFPIGGWWSAGYDIIARDSGVVVALGDTGVIVLNSTTLNYDAGASAPFVTTDWWGRNTQNGIYALAAAPGASSSAGASGRAAAASNRVVLAGAIPRWAIVSRAMSWRAGSATWRRRRRPPRSWSCAPAGRCPGRHSRSR